MKEMNWTKWFAIGLGGVLGVSHIGMIGMLARRDSSRLPSLNIPVGKYTSYETHVSENAYSVRYKANDPKVMQTVIERKKKGGFLNLANNTNKEVIQFTMDGAAHHGGPVSTNSAWIDPAAIAVQASNPKGELSDKTIACLKARGGGEQTGRLVGTSVGAAAAPTLSTIPFVGWLAAGWVAMFGGDQGSQIGGDMSAAMKDC